ncbi:hypothetical protein AAH978_11750 [Streptomyces sp. ZYX-F-203]
MRSLRTTLCAGVAVAAVAAPVAHGAEGDGVTVAPARPAPGTDVTLRLADCPERTALAGSPAFASDVRLALTGGTGELVGTARVRATSTAGSHPVRIHCGAEERTTTLDVTARPPAVPESGTAPDRSPGSPVASADTGDGGIVRLAVVDAGEDDARAEGPGTVHAVIGLVLAGAAAVAVAVRGVRRGRGTE